MTAPSLRMTGIRYREFWSREKQGPKARPLRGRGVGGSHPAGYLTM
jgi:hypothetical protein